MQAREDVSFFVAACRLWRTQLADPGLDRDHWGSGYAPRSVRLASADVGCLWGIRTEVVAGQTFPLVTGLQPWDCKSIAKASKVRILHLPPRAERAFDLRKRRSRALSLGPAVTGSKRLSTAVRPEYARKLRLQAPWSTPAPPVCAAARSHPGHIRTWRRVSGARSRSPQPLSSSRRRITCDASEGHFVVDRRGCRPVHWRRYGECHRRWAQGARSALADPVTVFGWWRASCWTGRARRGCGP
jgi:hypothetical protein